MDRLEKEERLEMKKRLENTWKAKKSHYDHLRWAKEILTEQILHVVEKGREPDEIREEGMSPEGRKGDEPEEVRHARTTGGTLHLTSQVVKGNLPEGVEHQKPKIVIEKEIGPEGWILGKKFQNKVRRLERARHQRDRLIRKLEEVWSFLEDGMLGLETDLEPHPMEEGIQT